MAIKKYHVSKNLFSGELSHLYPDGSNRVMSNSDMYSIIIKMSAGQVVTYSNIYSTSFQRYVLTDTEPQDSMPCNPYTTWEGTYVTITNSSQTDKWLVLTPYRESVTTITVETYFANVMLNEGSTALPYEPYDPEVWHDIPYRRYETATDTITSLPKTIIGDGQPINSYTIKGNMSQSGTPTPSNPIYPTECGEKTANLYDKDTAYFNNAARIDYNNNLWVTATGSSTLKFPCEPNTQYTLSVPQPLTVFRIALSNDVDIAPTSQGVSINVIVYDSGTSTSSYTFTTSADTQCVIFQGNSNSSDVWKNGLMFNKGSTVIPYEPFGYKISISSNSTALSPMYLTEPLMKIGDTVDTVLSTGTASRTIVKHIFTGNETLNFDGAASGRTTVDYAVSATANTEVVCTHIQWKSSYPSTDKNRLTITANKLYIAFDDTLLSDTTAEAVSEYLADQYTNGTPVTVWYVLATPTTESVTAPSIPTTGGTATIDVDTTVKPSEIDLTYHGWHSHEPLKRENGQWS